eukprot:PITA_21927
MKEIPILAKTIKELSIKKPGRKVNETKRIHLVGKIANIMMGKIAIQKYVYPGSPIVKTHIDGVEIPNTLIDLGASINIMREQTMEQLKLPNLLYTPTLLQLVDRSVIKPDGVLEDISLSLDSWEYPVDFMILTSKNNLGGHPLILGRTWLATIDAFISCRSGDMYIFYGNPTKKLTLYPPGRTIIEIDDKEWIDDENETQPLFTISYIREDNQILNTMENFESSLEYEHDQFQEKSNIEYFSSRQMSLYSIEEFGNSKIEIFLGRTLNINNNLEKLQREKLIKTLQQHFAAYAWEYTDMKGISPKTCIHQIYIEENCRPIGQPQRRMNPNLREIVKEKLQKLLNVNFIHPISDSQWVSPLVIVPKQNGKWRVCIDYRELNKATLKDHFPLPFIDQVLDTLVEGIVLGHHISGDGIKVDKSKVEVISKLSIPNFQRDIRSFLGFIGYYRQLIEIFIKIASLLFKLLTMDCEFNWNLDCQLEFETSKKKISEAPILRGPNWKLPFHISTDASDTALGDVLGKKYLIPYAIYYTSKNLTPTKLNYTVTENEFLVVVHAINKFRHYIRGYETFVHTDHFAVRYLMNKPTTNGRVTRSILLLQEFNITVLDRPGKQNTIAYFLSRIQNIKDDTPVEDKFPDEYLFAVTTQTPWFADIANYLVTG